MDGKNLTMILHGENEVTVGKEGLTGKCGVLPFVQKETEVTSTGLKWELNNTSISYGGVISSCNELGSEMVVIETNEPVIFTVEMKSDSAFFR